MLTKYAKLIYKISVHIVQFRMLHRKFLVVERRYHPSANPGHNNMYCRTLPPNVID